MRTVRIFSDGTPRGTHIFDAETEDELKGIQSLSLEVGLRQRTRAILTEKVYVENLVLTDVAAGTEAENAEADRQFADDRAAEVSGVFPEAVTVVQNCCGGSGC